MHNNSTDLFGNTPGKLCKQCKDFFPFAEFQPYTKKGRNYRFSYCRKCTNEKTRKWWHTPRGEKARRRIWLAKYGITPEQFEAMLLAQEGVCAICRCAETQRHASGRLMLLAVDHVHDATGKVRGLLCANCNQGIGCFRDDPKLLDSAIAYLEKHQ